MDFIDVKYINLISTRLDKFKKVKDGLYNFRCPVCGDSKKNKNKTRGYLYRVKNNINFKCHNCGANSSLSNFLKMIDVETHKSYVLEKFKEGKTGKSTPIKQPEFNFKKPVFNTKIDLPSAFDVERTRLYLNNRAIFDGKFYYAEKFKEWVNSVKPNSFEDIRYDEPRIIIPLYQDKKLIGIQGRALDSSPVKYLTIMIDEEAPKIYGLDSIDKNLPIYVVEGPFDSTFIDNCVALCGSDGDVGCLEGSNLIFVYDNEPRNKEIVNRISRTIERGNQIVIWPNGVKQKDINDMVLAGLNVNDMIKFNTYQGLEAKLKFTTWKKV